MLVKQSTEDRFWSKVNKIPDGCWIWTGTYDRKGYGQIKINHKTVKAHRWSWEFINGPVPYGKMILHSCVGQRNCVNPDHLRPGTNQENVNDKMDQGRQAKGESNGSSKLTETKVLEIREKYVTGFSWQKLSDMFNVSKKQIKNIVHRKNWKNI